MESQQNPSTGESVRAATDKATSDAKEIAGDLKRRGEQHLNSQKSTAAETARNLAGVVERAADELREQNQQSLADYAGQLAGSMKNFADNLKNRNTDELIRETQDLARRNPALFVLGSVAVGVALSRFFKASADRSGAAGTGSNDLDAEYQSRSVTFGSVPTSSAGTAPGSASPSETNPSFADDLDKGA